MVAGRLMPVLTEWELQRLTINIAYPMRRHLTTTKVRSLVVCGERSWRCTWARRASARRRSGFIQVADS